MTLKAKKLDDQRTALITDEYSNLIIAGAGSGKS
jgi:DNA helicase-4